MIAFSFEKINLKLPTACGMPASLENGYSTVSGFGEVVNENENVTYHCNEPYVMANDSLATLQCVNGSFQPSFVEANILCKLGNQLNCFIFSNLI